MNQNKPSQLSYANLDRRLHSIVDVQLIHSFNTVIFNEDLFSSFAMKNNNESSVTWLRNTLNIDGNNKKSYLAMAYAGHQFGHFTILGDGRACLIDEIKDQNGNIFDLSLKGCGRTSYARSGDGNATLGPMCREYLISEAMHALRIPTTRSLGVITTGNKVVRDSNQDGSMLLRVAKSHLRVGTFEYVRTFGDIDLLKELFEYSAKRHCPEILETTNPPLSFLKYVLNEQLKLVCQWQRVGFIHGVMNTDNTTISGETIDYGPCAFIDEYHPSTVFSSIDYQGRYSFENQPKIIIWNLTRLAETLLPLISKNESLAINKVKKILENGDEIYEKYYWSMMANKIGLMISTKESMELSNELLNLMQEYKYDYTNTFISLSDYLNHIENTLSPALQKWAEKWVLVIKKHSCIEQAIKLMGKTNPQVIPRNHMVEKALNDLTIEGNDKRFLSLLKRLQSPYKKENDSSFQNPPLPNEKVLATYCGT